MVQQGLAQKASLARPKWRCEAARLEGKGEFMRFLVVVAGALIAVVQLVWAQPGWAQPENTVAFRNETCGTVTLTVERETPIQQPGSSPAEAAASSAASCADAPGGCEVFAIDAGETRKATPAHEGSPQVIDVKIKGRCDQGPVTVISGHCIVDLNELDADDSDYSPAMSALDEYYYAAADPAFDLTRRIGFRTGSHQFSELRAAIGIALSDCDGDGVRQVCAAACRTR